MFRHGNQPTALLLLVTVIILLALGCSGGGGGNGARPIVSETESTALRDTVAAFLAAVRSSDLSGARTFLANPDLLGSNTVSMWFHDLRGASYTFSIDLNAIVYVSSDRAIVTAEGTVQPPNRMRLKFSLSKIGGFWTIDDIEPTIIVGTWPASATPFFIDTVRVGPVPVSTDRASPTVLANATPTFEIAFNTEGVNLGTAAWSVRVTDLASLTVYSNASEPTRFTITPSGSKTVFFNINSTPSTLRAGAVFSFDVAAPLLQNVSGTLLANVPPRYFRTPEAAAETATSTPPVKNPPAAPTVTQSVVGNTHSFIVTPAESGGFLYYSLDDGNTSATYTTPVVVSAPGTYRFTVWQADSLGNVGSRSTSITFTIIQPDTTAPAAPTVDGISAGIFNTSKTFTVTGAEQGGTLYYSLDNGTTSATYTQAITLSAGSYKVLAWQVDPAGNVGAKSNPIAIGIDTTAPTAPSVAGISAGTFNTAKTFTVTGAEQGGTLYYSLDNGTTSATYTQAITLSAGSYQVLVWQVDAAGNVGAKSSPIAIVIDITAPAAPSVAGISAGTFNTAKTFTVTGAEQGGTLYYSLDNGTTSATYTQAFTLTAGSYQVLAWQVDTAGNVGAKTSPIVIVIDTTAPAVPAVAGISAGTFNTAKTVTVTGAEQGGTLYYSLDNGTTSATYTQAFTLTAGSYQVLAWQVDTAGNVGAKTSPIAIVIDTTAPAAPTVAGISAGTFNTAKTFTVTGAEQGGTLYYSLDNGTTSATFTQAVTLTAGSYQVLAWQVDTAGNVGAKSSPIAILIDTTAPAAPTVADITAGTFNTAKTFTVTGAEQGGTLYYSLDNGTTFNIYTTGVTLNDGSYQVVARQVDAAGNTGVNSVAIVISIDTSSTVPVSWAFTYPKTTDQGPFGAKMAYKASRAGTVNYVALAAGASAPSATQIVAGTDAAGGTPLWRGTLNLTASTETSTNTAGLLPGTSYDIWSVCTDSSTNVTEPKKVTVTTTNLFTKIKDVADWSTRARFTPLWFNNRIYVIGGGNEVLNAQNTPIPNAQNDVWSSADGVTWQRDTSTMATNQEGNGREAYGASVFASKMWVLGGWQNSSGNPLKEIWSSTNGSAWNLDATLNEAWCGAGATDGRRGFGQVTYQPAGSNERLYVFGGYQGSSDSPPGTVKSDIWWSSNGTTWNALPDCPWAARQYFGHAVFGGKIYLIGGEDSDYQCRMDVWTFDGNNWENPVSVSNWGDRKEMKAVTVGDVLCVFGGRDTNGNIKSDLWYTRDGATWTVVNGAFTGTARTEPGIVTDGLHIYLMGGNTMTFDGNTPILLNDVWKM